MTPVAGDQRGRRVVSRIDPYTVLRFSALFYGSMYFVSLVAGFLLWVVASSTGVIDNIEQFIKELFAFDSFQLDGGAAFRVALVGGVVLVLVGTAANVMMAVFYNLTSDVVGGIEVIVDDQGPEPAPQQVSPAVQRPAKALGGLWYRRSSSGL